MTHPPDVSVILPCAGAGSRFGAPYPKELHCLRPGHTVVDEALRPVLSLAAQGLRVRLVVVISPPKTILMCHLERYRADLAVVFTFQTGAELGGAITSAIPLCAGPTLLVLPDQVLFGDGADTCLSRALRLLDEAPVAVVAAPLADSAELSREGAVRVEGSRITRAAEKPADPNGFNAAWAALAARPDQLTSLVAAVDGGTASPLVGAPAVVVSGYTNLTEPGRWRTDAASSSAARSR